MPILHRRSASVRGFAMACFATTGVVAIFLFTETARASLIPLPYEHDNALVADLGLHVVNVGYQRRVGEHVALQGSAGLYVPWTVNDDVLGLGGGHDGGDVGGAVLRLRPFFHPLGTSPHGFWISPFVQIGVVRGTRDDETHVSFAMAGGLAVGWTFRFGERWLLGLGAGAQYHLASFDGSTSPPGFARLGPHIDLNVDYRF